MSAAHTPGPWTRDKYGNVQAPQRGEPRRLETVRVVGLALSSGHEAEANARLIAAAPDLLAALRWYIANDDVIESMPGNEYWVAGLNAARAAIFKATGEQA